MNEWIEHTGTSRPVDPRITVEVELTNGTKQIGKADAFRMIGLEWERYPELDQLICDTEFGTYRCVRTYADSSVLYLNDEKLGVFTDGSHFEAMGTAQRHYDQRKAVT